MNDKDKNGDVNEISEMLIRLRPARSEIDTRVVFYEAGYTACQSQSPHQRAAVLPALMAAGLLGALVALPAVYQLGHSAAQRSTNEITSPVTSEQDEVGANDAATPPVDPPVRRDESESPRADERSPAQDQPQLFAQWNDPLGQVVARTKMQRQSEPTLSVFHSSLLTQDVRDLMSFPPATSLAGYRDSMPLSEPERSDSTQSALPLAVRDLQQLAKSLEPSQ